MLRRLHTRIIGLGAVCGLPPSPYGVAEVFLQSLPTPALVNPDKYARFAREEAEAQARENKHTNKSQTAESPSLGSAPSSAPEPFYDIVAAAAGHHHIVCVTREGDLITVGDNRFGQSARPTEQAGHDLQHLHGPFTEAACTTESVMQPYFVPLANYWLCAHGSRRRRGSSATSLRVCCGANFTIVYMSGGCRAVVCGNNHLGQLGLGYKGPFRATDKDRHCGTRAKRDHTEAHRMHAEGGRGGEEEQHPQRTARSNVEQEGLSAVPTPLAVWDEHSPWWRACPGGYLVQVVCGFNHVLVHLRRPVQRDAVHGTACHEGTGWDDDTRRCPDQSRTDEDDWASEKEEEEDVLYGFGSNSSGELGIGSHDTPTVPTRVPLPRQTTTTTPTTATTATTATTTEQQQQQQQQQLHAKQSPHCTGHTTRAHTTKDSRRVRIAKLAAGNSFSLLLSAEGRVYGCGEATAMTATALPLRQGPLAAAQWSALPLWRGMVYAAEHTPLVTKARAPMQTVPARVVWRRGHTDTSSCDAVVVTESSREGRLHTCGAHPAVAARDCRCGATRDGSHDSSSSSSHRHHHSPRLAKREGPTPTHSAASMHHRAADCVHANDPTPHTSHCAECVTEHANQEGIVDTRRLTGCASNDRRSRPDSIGSCHTPPAAERMPFSLARRLLRIRDIACVGCMAVYLTTRNELLIQGSLPAMGVHVAAPRLLRVNQSSARATLRQWGRQQQQQQQLKCREDREEDGVTMRGCVEAHPMHRDAGHTSARENRPWDNCTGIDATHNNTNNNTNNNNNSDSNDTNKDNNEDNETRGSGNIDTGQISHSNNDSDNCSGYDNVVGHCCRTAHVCCDGTYRDTGNDESADDDGGFDIVQLCPGPDTLLVRYRNGAWAGWGTNTESQLRTCLSPSAFSARGLRSTPARSATPPVTNRSGAYAPTGRRLGVNVAPALAAVALLPLLAPPANHADWRANGRPTERHTAERPSSPVCDADARRARALKGGNGVYQSDDSRRWGEEARARASSTTRRVDATTHRTCPSSRHASHAVTAVAGRGFSVVIDGEDAYRLPSPWPGSLCVTDDIYPPMQLPPPARQRKMVKLPQSRRA